MLIEKRILLLSFLIHCCYLLTFKESFDKLCKNQSHSICEEFQKIKFPKFPKKKSFLREKHLIEVCDKKNEKKDCEDLLKMLNS